MTTVDWVKNAVLFLVTEIMGNQMGLIEADSEGSGRSGVIGRLGREDKNES